jgi:hypothetical protein
MCSKVYLKELNKINLSQDMHKRKKTPRAQYLRINTHFSMRIYNIKRIFQLRYKIYNYKMTIKHLFYLILILINKYGKFVRYF